MGLAFSLRAHRSIVHVRVAIVCAVTTVLAIGCGSSQSAKQSPFPRGPLANDVELLQGRTVFARNCATCHGASGGGAVGPKFTGGKLQHDFPGIAAQVAFVKRGRGIMPAWGSVLTAEQIRAVVRYEREILSERR